MTEMKIWTGWADISATGEGRTICSMVAMAQDEAGFRTLVRDSLGAYIEQGFEVKQGVVRNGVTEALWAQKALDFVEENQSVGNFSAHASMHFNFG
ncbi:hypothetical protein F3K02_13920 [Hydrogenophaga sp. D2P1]|uniref:Uncharacterized protein n=1 Tax=Hydrogenophaga aromaticivorans TaxID=2610898 RepID=A0A7Y8GYG9_9BURK|nr:MULTISPECIES: hypothetical protein [Hydrogenophaga]NWF46338.1 hypothetical protein [Hydrogenophaga aromaticivorans]UCU93395.1 hypothetical protein KI616_21840 [Hydrogenophaga taeniospiralis]